MTGPWKDQDRLMGHSADRRPVRTNESVLYEVDDGPRTATGRVDYVDPLSMYTGNVEAKSAW